LDIRSPNNSELYADTCSDVSEGLLSEDSNLNATGEGPSKDIETGEENVEGGVNQPGNDDMIPGVDIVSHITGVTPRGQ
jgi:hypothetical protein